MIFKEFSDIEEVDEVQFDFCLFWLHLHCNPIGLSMESVARILGAKAGTVLKVEKRNNRASFGHGLKVRILVDISKPLKKRCWMSLSCGKRNWIDFKYERLSDFCYICGCVTHLEQDCDRVFQMKLRNQEINYN